MFTRITGGLSLALLMIALGCGAQKGQTRIKYEKNQQTNMITAQATGDYALYTTLDMAPQAVIPLEKGDRLGFERGEDGKVIAVAGEDYRQELSGSTLKAYWKYQGEKSDD